MILRAKALGIIMAFSLIVVSISAHAEIFHGVDFPDGEVSFADLVESYDPVIKSGQPTATYRVATEALGKPDYTEGPGVDYVSLGDGGIITLRFVDNSLTGSGDSTDDLWIFEIGPDVEDTFVKISMDNSTWYSVGKVFGATSGVDIDAFGFGPTDFFSYVRLTDDADEGDQTGNTVGADIDAVGAISSGPPVPIPEPGTLLLLGSGLVGLAGYGFSRKKKK